MCDLKVFQFSSCLNLKNVQLFRNSDSINLIDVAYLCRTMTSFDKLNRVIVDMYFHQSCPRNVSTASVLILALYSVVGQSTITLLRKNISAGALKVEHSIIKGVVMGIATYGAGASLDCLAGKLEGSRPADL